jgi:A/G-specific adenine glycosylase
MDWFAKQLLAWFEQHGRKDLPWQTDTSPYRVWVSEIMLQQTQVATVIGYYQHFMRRFPNVTELAAADIDEVLHLWTGLGYYARGRNLHKAAQRIVQDHNGELPDDQSQLEALPGIGPSTAGAIRAIAMQQRGVILDGNVKRVLARFHAIAGHYSQSAVMQTLWQRADEHTPNKRTAQYTQAIMDLGATLCSRSKPRCQECPVQSRCQALTQNRVDELPSKKKAAAKPVRQARFFVLSLTDQRILLEQRPQTGLWGGLWNPPERAADISPQAFLHSQGIDNDNVSEVVYGERFRHTFSHFHLDIEPIYLSLKREPLILRDAQQRWVAVDNLGDSEAAIGLSAAALKLVQQR